ncbi:MAG: nucleotidyl transferase AbiEii/AbiGii toxin family protein [Saprospiraceae bacterium]|nr:nucleotidyl transferase AbiEii/AbiGii toxin family protein [Saprospiraceae bacterium]
MLHLATVHPDTLGLLKKLMALPEMQGFNLAGGTALALQIGHRVSVDLDFFGDVGFDTAEMMSAIEEFAEVSIISQSRSILILNVNGVKVDVVRYRYPLLNPVLEVEGLRLLSPLDIGAMKLAAITNRGRKRDFFDLFFLLRQFTMRQLIDAYNAKYADGSEFLVMKSMVYFDDAEQDDQPGLLDSTVTWPEVKNAIEKAARKF